MSEVALFEEFTRRREDRERDWGCCPACGSRIEIEVTELRPTLSLVGGPCYGYISLEPNCPQGCFP